MELKVKHDVSPVNEILTNATSWCDIGGHKAQEWNMHSVGDVQVCEDCWDHFN